MIQSQATSPVVRERLIDVLAAAAFTFRKEGFQSAWKRIRPRNKPEDGIPFDMDDSMFQPSMERYRTLSLTPQVPPMNAPGSPHLHRLSSESQDLDQSQDRGRRDRELPQPRDQRVFASDAPKEGMRRLFEECDVARYSTRILNESLVYATPDSLRSNPVIRVLLLSGL